MTSVELRDMAQDLYDGLTCAGIRGEIWPALPAEDADALGNRIEDAFVIIDDYIDRLRLIEDGRYVHTRV